MLDVRGTILERILQEAQTDLAAAQALCPLPELRRRLDDAPPVRALPEALRSGFGLIAEIKARSPSQGLMRPANVAEAPAAYERSSLVHALSVLTNAPYFGMSLERLSQIRAGTRKPVLRKDFIFDAYQVYEARAFGADAVLLMANLLERDELRRLYDVTRELGMEALFECHDRAQIEALPPEARVIGINSRTFAVTGAAYDAAQAQRASGATRDLTTDLSRFELGRHLPPQAIKVAESGVSPATVAAVRDLGLFQAVLVGTSLLLAPHGLAKELEAFEQALA
jgi:indole-3-glycerol phosphate synthase